MIQDTPIGVYTVAVEPVYNGHTWDLQKWLLYSGDLIIQSGFYVFNWKEINLGFELVAVIE